MREGLINSRVGSGIGHGEKTGTAVLDLEVLIGKLLAIDGFSTSTLTGVVSSQRVVIRSQSSCMSSRWERVGAHIATGKVTTLKHEVGNDSVEFRALVAIALRAGAERAEVLGSFGNGLVVELEVDSALLV